MSGGFNLYDGHYGNLADDAQAEVRRETYGEDLGQASWLTAAEARADRDGLSELVSFKTVDAGGRLPFADASFDAVFCNDSINHLPDRADVFADWRRLLRPGGRVLFSDPIVVTGQLTGDEMRARSSIGYFLFTPAGYNEQLLEAAGFTLLDVRNVTEAVASVAQRWRDARESRRDRLVPLEGEEGFAGLQRFLGVAHTLAAERRLSRFMYLAERPAATTREGGKR